MQTAAGKNFARRVGCDGCEMSAGAQYNKRASALLTQFFLRTGIWREPAKGALSSKNASRCAATDLVCYAFGENKHKDGGIRVKRTRIVAWILALVWLVVPCALAETDGPNLVSTEAGGLQAAETEAGATEAYSAENGLLYIELLVVDAMEGGDFPLVGEVNFADFLAQRFGVPVDAMEEWYCAPVSSYPARRLHFEMDTDEEKFVVDAIAVWTQPRALVCVLRADADAYYGNLVGYENGEMPAAMEAWIASLAVVDPDGAYLPPEGNWYEITLVADFSMGSGEGETVSYPMSTKEPFSIELLAEGLSVLTGLDFFVSGELTEAGVVVDWHGDSTLVAGLDDRAQREGFFFYDVDSLNWFMMDSLYATICANVGEMDVFYTMEGGAPLSLPNMSASPVFPTDASYARSGLAD